MDASAHRLNSVGTENLDVPQSVQANVRNAEAQILLNRLLGLPMNARNELQLAQFSNQEIRDRMLDRLYSGVNDTRVSLNRIQLGENLDRSIAEALLQLAPGETLDRTNDNRRVLAIAQAAYQSIPADMLDQFAFAEATNNVVLDSGEGPANVIEMRGVVIGSFNGTQPLRMSLNAPFWRNRPYVDRDDLIRAITNRLPADLGIDDALIDHNDRHGLQGNTNVIPELHQMSSADAAHIVDQRFDAVSVPPVGAEEKTTVTMPDGTSTEFKIKARQMLTDNTGIDAPRGLQNRNIAALSPMGLAALLAYRNSNGEYVFWKKYVDPSTASPTMLDLSRTRLADRISERVLRATLGTGASRQESVMVNGVTFDLALKISIMYSARTDNDAPTGLQNVDVPSLNQAQVMQLLRYQNASGDYPYWNRFVEAGSGCRPIDIDTNSNQRLWRRIQRMVPNAAINPGPLGRRRNIRLLDVISNLTAGQQDSRALLTKLQTGSENNGGATMAATMALRDPGLYAVAVTGTEEKAKKDVAAARAKIDILDLTSKLKELEFKPQITAFKAPGAPAVSLERLRDEASNLAIDRNAIGQRATKTTWESDFAKDPANPLQAAHPKDIEEHYNSTTRRDENEHARKDAQAKLASRISEVQAEIARYNKLESMLSKITLAAVEADLYDKCPPLSKLMKKDGKPQTDQLIPTVDTNAQAEEIIKSLALGSRPDLEEALKKVELTLKKAKEGGEKGDGLQQRIFEEYFKRQGLSPLEAQKSANYMYARSLVDHELSGQIRSLQDDLFGHHRETGLLNPGAYAERYREWNPGRPERVLERFAQNVGLHPLPRSFRTNLYNWQTLPYPKLITSYFGLKKLWEGSGPEYINCPGSPYIKSQMSDIAGAIAVKHVPALINDFGNDLPDEDRAKLQSRKTLSVQSLEKILTGDAPEKYRERIDHVLHHTDERTDRFRRGAWDVTAKSASSIAAASKTTAQFAGNSVKAAWETTKKNRKNIATFALFTALGGPMGMAAWGIYKSLDSAAPAAPAAHH